MHQKDASQLGPRNRRWAMLFLGPCLIGFVVLTALPVGLSFYYSFCRYSLLKPPVYVGAENYRELMRDDVFWEALVNTVYCAAMALPGGLMVSLGLAMLLNVEIPGRALWRTIIFLPSLVPIVAS